MAYPRPPGGQFPLTTAPTGNKAGGQYPTADRLRSSILALSPTAYWPLDDAASPLRDLGGGAYGGTVTGSPTYAVAAPNPIGSGVTFSGSGQYATTSASLPTPASGISVFALFNTSSTAGTKHIAGRYSVGQASWIMDVTAAGSGRFFVFQSNGSSHATAGWGGGNLMAAGSWCALLGTFDGTTVSTTGAAGSTVSTGTSTTLTGAWHTASTVAAQIASANTSNLFPGTLAHVAYWADRILTVADFRYLRSIAFGV